MSHRLCVSAFALVAAVVANNAKADFSGTYASLIAGPAVTVGNATYSNFTIGGNVDPSNIIVTITTPSDGISKITFTPVPGSWVTNPTNPLSNGNSQLEYNVNFAQPINAVGLSFVAAGSLGGIASVGETLNHAFTLDPSVTTDGAGPLPDVFQTVQTFGPTTTLDVQKSVDLAGSSPASITSVDNTYIVPEPASLSVLGLGGLLLMRRRLAR